ncbi:hypothetical protein [Halalkalibacter urbisdiaboli]|uniref:hypothetical protein n=1 Tax=Halalkalibacter urbisdiaboli TaxID=1960589 RepID=UPI000B44B541|nr:hypothetical protein [Halalkalibacter urbisdiaboli]
MSKQEKLKAFALEMKEGFQLVKQKKDHEAIEKLSPFVTLMKQSGANQIRLFVYYSIAQIRTGDIEGFLSTYEQTKQMKPNTDEEQELLNEMDKLFFDLMEELGQKENQ